MSKLINRATANSSRLARGVTPSSANKARQAVEVGSDSIVSGVSATATVTSSIEQGVSAGSGSTIEGNTFITNIRAAEQSFFFDVTIHEVNNRGGDDPVYHYMPLRAGTTYIVRVASALNEYKEDPQKNPHVWKMNPSVVKTEGCLSLVIVEEFMKGSEGAFESPEGLCTFDPSIKNWSYDFRLTTKEILCSDSARINLLYYRGNKTAPRTSTCLEVLLKKTEGATPDSQEDSKNSCPHYLFLEAEPPPKTSFLHIVPEGEDELKFVGWGNLPGVSRSDIGSVAIPIEELEDLGGDIEYLENIYSILNDVARGKLIDLINWLKKTLSLMGEDCRLIIVDQSSFQFPWELLLLEEGNHQYLGTRANIVRWIEDQYINQPVMLQLEDAECKGSLSAYVHSQERLSSQFNSLSPYYCEDISDLPSQLAIDKEQLEIGLIYLSHADILIHRNKEKKAVKQFFQSFQNSERLNCFRMRTDPAFRSQQPVFFVNAPYSGRLWYFDQEALGLLKAALTQMASGYIGVLGPTDCELGTSVITDFLEKSSSQGIFPADFLRQLRESKLKAYKKASQSPHTAKDKQARNKMLYSFMYVYYGNPQMFLKVVPSKVLPSEWAEGERI